MPLPTLSGPRGTSMSITRSLPVMLAVWCVVAAVLVATARPAGVTPTVNPHIAEANPRAATVTAVPAMPVTTEDLARLPTVTTFATIPAAPRDPAPRHLPSGRVAHPRRTVAVYESPGGSAIAALPSRQLGADTWLPVIDERPGWLRVLLPSRPNGSTGWLHHTPGDLRIAHSPYRIVVDRGNRRLTLYRGDTAVAGWRVGVGKPRTPTPRGRTFLLASIRETRPTFSPIVLPLGAHSNTYTSYAGGPGTIGIHTWPTGDTYGTASSDGCIRVPPDALTDISATVPLGTPVLVR